MTVHKYAEMIKTKADNMELVVFKYSGVYAKWIESDFVSLIDDPDHLYFLCLPQHKEACLHWLQGDIIEYSHDQGNSWTWYDLSVDQPKYPLEDMTGSEFIFRIKPEKVARWVATLNGWNASQRVFSSKQEAIDVLGSDGYQFHEIEVEV